MSPSKRDLFLDRDIAVCTALSQCPQLNTKLLERHSWEENFACSYWKIKFSNAAHVNEPGSNLSGKYLYSMFIFIAWIILFILCWPLAILALVLYPFFWILSLPFRLIGIAVDGVFSLLKGIIMLPGRLLRR